MTRNAEMGKKEGTTFDQFKAELLQDAEVRKEYDALKPKYDIIHSIIERRNELQLSQSRLARIIGTKQPAISRLERGDYNTTLNTLFRVARALNLDLNISLEANGKSKPSRKKLVFSK